MHTNESRGTTQLIRTAVDILEQDGPMTILQLFWRLVSAGEIHNNVENYHRFRQLMTKLRDDRRCLSRLIIDGALLTIDSN
jgi:hypothetical protein